MRDALRQEENRNVSRRPREIRAFKHRFSHLFLIIYDAAGKTRNTRVSVIITVGARRTLFLLSSNIR